MHHPVIVRYCEINYPRYTPEYGDAVVATLKEALYEDTSYIDHITWVNMVEAITQVTGSGQACEEDFSYVYAEGEWCDPSFFSLIESFTHVADFSEKSLEDYL